MILKPEISTEGITPNINLKFNLYPEINVYVDMATDWGMDSSNQVFKIFGRTMDVSKCTANIRIKTVLYNSCGQLTCEFLHSDCSQFKEGDRIRVYIDGECRFCGFIFTRSFSLDKMSVTCFDFLRYFKAPLFYDKKMLSNSSGTVGLSLSGIFQKICTDLAIPYAIKEESNIPIPPMRFDNKSGFHILDYAISQTIVNSPENQRLYYMYYHESNIDEEELLKTSGQVQLRLRNNLTTDTVISDENIITDYEFSSSIDSNTYNDIILYKREKTYLSKTGKSLKNGRYTGTVETRSYADNDKKGLWGYLPLIQEVPDSYTVAQMDKVGKELLQALSRPSQSISVPVLGLPGLRAGYLVPTLIQNFEGVRIGAVKQNQDGTETVLPVYRTVKSCDLQVEHPIRAKIELSSAEFGELDV